MLTQAEAAQIHTLLHELLHELGGTKFVAAVAYARAIIQRETEGCQLPQQLVLAQRAGALPRCTHHCSLMDWSGEQLTPPCGCRLVEPAGVTLTRTTFGATLTVPAGTTLAHLGRALVRKGIPAEAAPARPKPRKRRAK